MFKWLFGTNRKTPNGPSESPSSLTNTRVMDASTAAEQRPIDLALQHHQAERLAEAEAAYQAILAADPDNIDALHFSGVAAFQRGDHERAAQLMSKALSLNPSNAPAQNNKGIVLEAQGKRDEAIACYRKALALTPDYVDALFNLGDAVGAAGGLDEAVALAPDSPHAHFRLANALRDQGRLEEAVGSYRKALALGPDNFAAHNNLGNVLHELEHLDEAVSCFRKVLVLKPDYAEAHFNLGNVLRDQGRMDEAAAAHEAALGLKPDFPEAHFGLGLAHADQGQCDEAIGCFRRVLFLNPDHAAARWAAAMCRIPPVHESAADFARSRAAFSSELTELEHWFDAKRVAHGFVAVGVQQPFWLPYQEEDNRDLLGSYGRLCARLMGHWRERQGLRPAGRRSRGAIRVGIVSRHIRRHSVWNAIVKGWFQRFDRERFALAVFCLGPEQDAETHYARSRAARFVQGVGGLRQWVEAVLAAQPDVLIFPEIGMDPMTVKLASLRLAPVQVASWGHPETSGLPTIDYYLSAEDLEPAGAQAYYTERLVTLPHLGCYFQPGRVEAAVPDLGQWGIDARAPLLLCPGTPFKYAPQHDGVFPQIARRLGGCRFVFFNHGQSGLSEKLRRRLEVEFARSGLDFEDFVSFIPWQDKAGFYGLLERADVFLDTIGFSGFNTALQAVECGLPIVTREGRFMRGRLASGLLKRMGLPELVVPSEQDYVTLAVRLARDADYREHIRGRIAESRHVLFEDIEPIHALETFLAKASKGGGDLGGARR